MNSPRRSSVRQAMADEPKPDGEQKPGTALARTDPAREFLENMREEITAQLPGQITADRFIRICLTGLKASKQAVKLAQCTRPSLQAAILQAAYYGLMPFTDEGAIVPFGDTATFIAQYQGFVSMFYRTGQVAKVTAKLIAKGDDWDEGYGPGLGFYHKPRRFTPDGTTILRGTEENPWILAYCYVTLKGGEPTEVEVVTREEAEYVRDNYSRSYQNAEKSWHGEPPKRDSAWHTDFPAMWLKGLALDTPIPTVAGWRTMGDLHLGDQVFDRDGQPVRITATSEIKHLSCYRVQFTSGPPVICDAEHLWVARIGRDAERVHPIASLAAAKAAGQPVIVPVSRAISLPAADLPVDPWLLGFWLGDGNRTKPSVTCDASEVAEVEAAILSAGYQTGVRPDPRSNAATINIRGGLSKQLAEIGVLGSKNVPGKYLRGSAGQRLALLRGLMDADGTVWTRSSASRVRFYNTDQQLASAVAELARSLGEQVLEVEYDGRGLGKIVHVFQVSWTPTVMPFALSDKKGRTRLRLRSSYGHRIKSIEAVDSVPTRCIAVSSPTRTYLAGAAMVPTHNTAVRREAKWAPKSPELVELLVADRQADLRTTAQQVFVPGGPAAAWPGDVGYQGGTVVDGEVVDDPWAAEPGTAPAGGGPTADGAPDAAGEAADPRTPEQVKADRGRDQALETVVRLLSGHGFGGEVHRPVRLALLRVLSVPFGAEPATFDEPGQVTLEQARTAEKNLRGVINRCNREKLVISTELRRIAEEYAEKLEAEAAAQAAEPAASGG